MREYVVSSSRNVVLFGLALGLALGSVLVVGFRVFPAGADHAGDGTIHACVNNTTGATRIVSSPHQCRSYETLVEWGNQTPFSGYEIVTDTKGINNNQSIGISVSCPDGKNVLGGGVKTTAIPGFKTLYVQNSFPADDTSWSARILNMSGSGNTIEGYAICTYTD